MDDFERFRKQRTIVLTTFKRDGTAVPTAVSIAVDNDPTNAFVRTWSTAGKAKRLRHDHRVVIAPSTMRGRTTGPEMPATAHLLAGDESGHAARLLRRKYPVLHGVVVPLAHKLRRYTTQHYRLQVDRDEAATRHRAR
jgi:PPOX class probable F420-dependent enzyme